MGHRKFEETILDRLANTDALERAFVLLVGRQLLYIYLVAVEGWSYAEIARIMEVTPRTVRDNVYRGLDKLLKPKKYLCKGDLKTAMD